MLGRSTDKLSIDARESGESCHATLAMSIIMEHLPRGTRHSDDLSLTYSLSLHLLSPSPATEPPTQF